MPERGDLISYELSLGFGIKTDEALSAINNVSKKITYLEDQMSSLGNVFSDIFTAKDATTQINSITNQFDGVISQISNVQKSLFGVDFGKFNDDVTMQFTDVLDKLSSFDFVGIGSTIIEQLSQGILDSKKILLDNTTKILESFADYFPQSPAKDGPLVKLWYWGKGIVGQISQGVADNWKLIVTAMGAGWAAIRVGSYGFARGLGTMINDVGRMMVGSWRSIVGVAEGGVNILIGLAGYAARLVAQVWSTNMWSNLNQLSERFRTVNNRVYGSMNALNLESRRTADAFGLLNNEAGDAMDALIRLKVPRRELHMMAGALGQVVRISGVGAEQLATLSAKWGGAGDSAMVLRNNVSDLVRTMRLFSLTNADVAKATQVGDNSFAMLKSTLGNNYKEFEKFQLRLTGVANQLVATGELTQGQVDGIGDAMKNIFANPMNQFKAEAYFGFQLKSTEDIQRAQAELGKRLAKIYDPANPKRYFLQAQKIGEAIGINLNPASAEAYRKVYDNLIKDYAKYGIVVNDVDMHSMENLRKLQEAKAQASGDQYLIKELQRQRAGIDLQKEFADSTDSFTQAWTRLQNTINNLSARALLPFESLFIKIMGPANSFIESLSNKIEELSKSTAFSGFIDRALTKIDALATKIVSAVRPQLDWLLDTLFNESMFEQGSLISTLTDGLFGFANAVIAEVPNVLNILGGLWDGTKAIFNMFMAEMGPTGNGLIAALSNGISMAGPLLENAILEVFRMIERYLPHSDADDGPFKSLTSSGKGLVAAISAGVTDAKKYLVGAVVDVAHSAMQGLMKKFRDTNLGPWMQTLFDSFITINPSDPKLETPDIKPAAEINNIDMAQQAEEMQRGVEKTIRMKLETEKTAQDVEPITKEQKIPNTIAQTKLLTDYDADDDAELTMMSKILEVLESIDRRMHKNNERQLDRNTEADFNNFTDVIGKF